ncbi:MAG: hypothetical protein ABH816_01960 [Candidatus Levyibacteriota bacterium]
MALVEQENTGLKKVLDEFDGIKEIKEGCGKFPSVYPKKDNHTLSSAKLSQTSLNVCTAAYEYADLYRLDLQDPKIVPVPLFYGLIRPPCDEISKVLVENNINPDKLALSVQVVIQDYIQTH